MGVYYTSYAVLGVVVSAKGPRFTEKAQVPSCEHPEREGQAYCPSCGTKVETKTRSRRTPLYEALDTMAREDERTVELRDGYLFEDFHDGDRYVIGFGVRSDRDDPYDSVREIPPIEEIKAYVRELLEPFGLYDESRFGLYSLTIGF